MKGFGSCLSLWLLGAQGALSHSSVLSGRPLGIILHISAGSHIWPSWLHAGFCLFSSVSVSIIYWHIHCQVRIKHRVNTPILRILPTNPEHCHTPAKPCISGMENDCHLSPSFHLLTDGLWILTSLLYNEQRMLAYRKAEHGGAYNQDGLKWNCELSVRLKPNTPCVFKLDLLKWSFQ